MTTRVAQSDLPRPTRHTTRADIPTRPHRIADGSPVNRMIDRPVRKTFTNENGNDAVGLSERIA